MLTALLFLVGIVLIGGVMAYFGFNEVLTVMSSADIYYIVIALLLQLGMLLLLAVRFVLISKRYKRVGFWDAFKISMAGTAISLITPIARVGGEPLKIYLLKKKIGGSKASAVVAVDTLSELASSFLVLLFVFIAFFSDIPGSILPSFLVFFVVVAVVLIVMVKMLLSPDLLRRIINWGSQKVSKYTKVDKKDYALLFYKAFRHLLQDEKVVFSALLVSFVAKVLEFARMWFVFAALGVLLPLDVVIIVWAVILVLYLVPWLPGSLGLVEFFGAGAFVLFGIASGVAAGGLIIDRFISFWFVLVIGLFIASTFKVPKEVKK